MKKKIDEVMEKIEEILGMGCVKKDVILLAVSATALFMSIFDIGVLPFDPEWIAVSLCFLPATMKMRRWKQHL